MTSHDCPSCKCDLWEKPPPAGRGSSDDKRRRLLDSTRRQLADQKRERSAVPSRVRRGNENEEHLEDTA